MLAFVPKRAEYKAARELWFGKQLEYVIYKS